MAYCGDRPSSDRPSNACACYSFGGVNPHCPNACHCHDAARAAVDASIRAAIARSEYAPGCVRDISWEASRARQAPPASRRSF